MRTIQWEIWGLPQDFLSQVNLRLHLEARNSKAEADLLAFSDQVMEVVDRVAAKTEQSLLWRI